eukprot:698779-Pyramimonas_sp.AAC.1
MSMGLGAPLQRRVEVRHHSWCLASVAQHALGLPLQEALDLGGGHVLKRRAPLHCLGQRDEVLSEGRNTGEATRPIARRMPSQQPADGRAFTESIWTR